MNLYGLIVEVAQKYLSLQNENGSFEAGHNGPYYDDELPIRNTSHVLILLLKAYDISQDEIYLKAGKKAVQYVLDDSRRPMKANCWCRKNPNKDFCNGLIGPAWIIEALCYARPYFSDLPCQELAEEIFLMHPFDEKAGVWRVVNVDGSYSGVDLTFNHQLWFAATAVELIGKNATINERISKFLDCLDVNLDIYENGLIMHALQPKRSLKLKIRDYIKFQKGVAYKNKVIHKAIGYHAFNTYAFALIYHQYSSHKFWSTDKFKKIIEFMHNPLYIQGLDYSINEPVTKKKLPFNKYGYAYNPPGIEVAYTLQTFQDKYDIETGLSEKWLSRQFEKVLFKESKMMNENTDDPVTLSARFYEAVRLNDMNVKID